MTPACILMDTLRNNTQMFLKFKDLFTSHQLELHSLLLIFIDAEQRRGNIKGNPAWSNVRYHYPQYRSLSYFNFLIQLLDKEVYSISFIKINMSSNVSIDSMDSDVFFVEQLSNEPSPQRNNSPNILNSTELSQASSTELRTVSSIASPEPQIVTLNDDSNHPTMPCGFGRQLPIIPPSLNNLNLPPNPFNILATMAVVNQEHDDNYS